MILEPTEENINNICMNVRHDFGLLTGAEREKVVFDAKIWLEAINKEAEFILNVKYKKTTPKEKVSQDIIELSERINHHQDSLNSLVGELKKSINLLNDLEKKIEEKIK